MESIDSCEFDILTFVTLLSKNTSSPELNNFYLN